MTHHQKAQSGYQPTWQAGADQDFQGLQKTVSGAAQNLATTAPGQYQDIYKNVQNNPFYQQAQQGANDASQIGHDYVAPSQLYGAQREMQAGDQAGDWATKVMQQGGYGFLPRARADAQRLYDAMPQATAGFGLARPAYDSAMGKANDIYGQQTDMANQIYGLNMDMAQATIPGQIDAANHVLQTGYDPQRQLYDRSYQQMMEQQNAINAQQGVSGSPFAAGASGDASRNFNTDWQNQQLQRQISSLGAYSGAMGGATSNFNSLINGGAGGTAGGLLSSAAGNYANLSNAGSGQFNDMTNSATGNLNTLTTSADKMIQDAKVHEQNSQSQAIQNYLSLLGGQQGSYANASDLGAAGLNTMTTAAMYPNQVYMNQQNQVLQALNAMVGGTGQALAPANQAISNDLNYMKTGQSATQLQQQAAQQNNAANAQMMGGIGQIAGLALAPFTGGMSLAASGAMGGAGGGGGAGPGNASWLAFS